MKERKTQDANEMGNEIQTKTIAQNERVETPIPDLALFITEHNWINVESIIIHAKHGIVLFP